MNLLIFLTISSIVSLKITSASISSAQWKSYYFPSKKIVFNEYTFKNTTLVYALCDQGTDFSDSPTRICQVILEDVTATHSCNVTLDVDENTNDLFEMNIEPDMNLKPLDENRALFVSCREDNFVCYPVFHIVHFPTCEIFETKIDVQSYDSMPIDVSLVDRKDSYEAFFEDKGRSSILRLKIDAKNGKIIEGPAVWMNVGRRDFKRFISPLDSADNFLLIEKNCDRCAKSSRRNSSYLCGNASLIGKNGNFFNDNFYDRAL